MSPRVLVVVLNWNSAADCLRCLASLQRLTYAAVQILVVDNGSTDDSLAQIRSGGFGVEVCESNRNLGYAGGNNRGIREGLARGFDYVWLVNPDVVVEADSLAALVEVGEADPHNGMIGPLVYCMERPDELLSAGGVFGRGRDWHRWIVELDPHVPAAAAEVGFLSGCALLVKRTMVEAVGLLDERFFLYEEDVEWCYRARRAGWRVAVAARARVWHPDTRTRDRLAARVTYYITRNQLLLIRTHRLGARLTAGVLLRHLRTLVSWTVRPKWRHKRAQRRALARALLDAARGRWGAAGDL